MIYTIHLNEYWTVCMEYTDLSWALSLATGQRCVHFTSAPLSALICISPFCALLCISLESSRNINTEEGIKCRGSWEKRSANLRSTHLSRRRLMHSIVCTHTASFLQIFPRFESWIFDLKYHVIIETRGGEILGLVQTFSPRFRQIHPIWSGIATAAHCVSKTQPRFANYQNKHIPFDCRYLFCRIPFHLPL